MGLDGMRAPGLEKPGAFLWLFQWREFGMLGDAWLAVLHLFQSLKSTVVR